jgi:mannose-6-phosphate isomerase
MVSPDSARDPRPDVVTVERPWGRFTRFTHNEATTVKTITVEPGQRLSLQRHQLRGELWQVLVGPLDVTVGEDTWAAQTGELVWVPVGQVHRVGNPGPVAGALLEIAFGPFDEDDLERLDDDYARS